jgi:hypothetical protein
MQPARPLRDVFDEVARGDLGADPAETLAGSGHGDLPDQLVSDAIVSYADTAPVEVAEHLAPFVKVHSAVPAGDAGADLPASDGFDLLASAPEPIVADDDTTDEPGAGEAGAVDLQYPDAIDFGFGSGADQPGIEAVPSIEDAEGVPVEPGPADDLPAPEQTTAEPVYPWLAPPEAEAADEPEEGDAVG